MFNLDKKWIQPLIFLLPCELHATNCTKIASCGRSLNQTKLNNFTATFKVNGFHRGLKFSNSKAMSHSTEVRVWAAVWMLTEGTAHQAQKKIRSKLKNIAVPSHWSFKLWKENLLTTGNVHSRKSGSGRPRSSKFLSLFHFSRFPITLRFLFQLDQIKT